MKTLLPLSLLALATLILFVTASAQDATTAELPRLDDGAAIVPVTPVAPTNSVFIIVCDAKPGQILVLDSTGTWLSTVRDAKIEFIIGENTPKVTCTMWSGPLKPTKPDVKSWDLAQLKSVTDAEFQKMVDSLQVDPEAIRRRVTEPAAE